MKSSADYLAYKESLVAAARGPFFPEWEFHSLFGFDRLEFEAIADSFSPGTPLTGDVALALNGAMGNLIGYPHNLEAIWHQWLSVTPVELQAIFSRWRASRIEA